MPPFELAIRGNIVLPDVVLYDHWLAVRDGRIAGLGSEPPEAERTHDERGKWLLPGGIDAHVHSGSSAVHKEGFARLTRGAAAGGVTTVIEMPYDAPEPLTGPDQFRAKVSAIQQEAVVDVALFGTVPKVDGYRYILPLAELGVCAFKFSTYETDTHRFPRIPDNEIVRIFAELQKVGLTAAFHAENGELVDTLVKELRPLGEAHPEAHCWSRPPEAETTAVGTLLELARTHPVKLHIVHLTVPFGYDLIDFYRLRRVDASAETCIQYLILDEGDLGRLGAFAKCNPPLRSAEMREALWQKLLSGQVDFVTSDHAPWPDEVKTKPNIFDNSSGLPGVEVLVPLLYSAGVVKRGLDIHSFARLISTNPAQRYGLYPRKGALLVGADADIMVLDPQASYAVSGSQMQSLATTSPYEGMQVTGRVTRTFVRGTEVFNGQSVTGQSGHGKFIPRLS